MPNCVYYQLDAVEGFRKCPPKAIYKDNHKLFLIFSVKCRILKRRFFAFPRGPGGFREVRGAGRNHFHLSWYLLEPGVTSYDQKTNKEKTHIKTYFIGDVFLNNLVWTQFLRPGT